MTDLRQAAKAVLDAWDSPLWKTGTTAAKIADLRTALEQQAEPVAWIAEVELSVFARTPKEKTTVEIWKKPVLDSDVAVYTTPPQRQWVGLTDEDVNRESAPIAQQMKLAFHAGMYVAQEILKEKNSD